MSQKYFSLRFGKVIAIYQEIVVIRYHNGKEEALQFNGNLFVGDAVCVKEVSGKKSVFPSLYLALQEKDF